MVAQRQPEFDLYEMVMLVEKWLGFLVAQKQPEFELHEMVMLVGKQLWIQ